MVWKVAKFTQLSEHDLEYICPVIRGYPSLSTFSLCTLKGTIGQEVKAEKRIVE